MPSQGKSGRGRGRPLSGAACRGVLPKRSARTTSGRPPASGPPVASAQPAASGPPGVWISSEAKFHRLLRNLFGEVLWQTLGRVFGVPEDEEHLSVGKCDTGGGLTVNITPHDLRKLTNGCWLNDTVVEAYLGMIRKRCEQKGLRKVFVTSPQFYKQMVLKGYNGVKSWFRQVNLFAFDVLLFPIHDENHWSLVIVDLNEGFFLYYDPLPFASEKEGENLAWEYIRRVKYVIDEEARVKERKVDYSGSFVYFGLNWPHQENGFDCGVFVLAFADWFCRPGSTLAFRQSHMDAYRLQYMAELLCGRLLEPPPPKPTADEDASGPSGLPSQVPPKKEESKESAGSS